MLRSDLQSQLSIQKINQNDSFLKLEISNTFFFWFIGIGMLSQLPDEVTERSERIGRNLAVALQAFIELQPFIEENHFDSDLSLGSAPVLFHLQNDSKLLEYIGTCEGDIDNLDLKKVTLFSLPEP